MDDRAVGSTINYVLSLAIASVLVTGLMLAGGTFVDDRRTEVIRNELTVVGQQVAADLERADRLVRAGETAAGTEVTLVRQFPERITGLRYRIETVPGSPDRVRLVVGEHDVSVTVRVDTATPIGAASAQGGTIEVSYTGAGELVIDDG